MSLTRLNAASAVAIIAALSLVCSCGRGAAEGGRAQERQAQVVDDTLESLKDSNPGTSALEPEEVRKTVGEDFTAMTDRLARYGWDAVSDVPQVEVAFAYRLSAPRRDGLRMFWSQKDTDIAALRVRVIQSDLVCSDTVYTIPDWLRQDAQKHPFVVYLFGVAVEREVLREGVFERELGIIGSGADQRLGAVSLPDPQQTRFHAFVSLIDSRGREGVAKKLPPVLTDP